MSRLMFRHQRTGPVLPSSSSGGDISTQLSDVTVAHIEQQLDVPIVAYPRSCGPSVPLRPCVHHVCAGTGRV